MRKCKKCGRRFKPSSNHLNCPTCRGRARPKKPCADCGRAIRYDRERCRGCSCVKENNGAWKGGKTYHKSGYVMVLAPEHHRAGSSRYVFEHIIVMEEKIGRSLLPGETVHHKNGVKDDNRRRNLELWRGPQPSGARVSDLVKWAKELLALYDPGSLR